ncbi:molybdopterin molybdotransferase MoeA [Oceanobacillus alkalisoli]|uniref:molybdopterin molybdotransferase MoeA n=1 Tax=Oceanobacillus alkalisoli TaxID=2925113 RepID=UPI001EEFF486|nr:gephyrin-like molybdotransferase Glp [Oceanobacillus alkalisoli]MCF3944386.1 molybdopterin molybdotransferase MoeA [Oceanobacillus alkalisoli]MCG5102153.1 molybdopterin molybdotransferase MoeA [Oceanobacillus alkalisoli]
MVEIRTPIEVNDAIERVMKYAVKGEKTFIPLEESHGFFLAEDLISDHAVPPFDRTRYDGFAIRSEATENGDSRLEVVGQIGAGSVFEGTVKENEAVRIMTGAEIPAGCDAVIMLEHVKETSQGEKRFIEFTRKLTSFENITKTGEDTQKGEVLVQKGTYINPGIMALLATFGYRQVPIVKRPRVGIISTGSELLPVDAALEPGKIRDSNSYMLIGQIERAGGIPVSLGQFADDLDICYDQVVAALDEVDILLTTGGVSVGDYDYIPAILERLNANVLFNKIKMRPGSVTTVAEVDGKLFFGLSGNPSSCYVGFELYTRPAIRNHLHTKNPYLKKLTAQLGTDFTAPNPFHRFVRGKLIYESGNVIAVPVGLDKPNIVTSLAEANVLIVLPGNKEGYEAGEQVMAVLLADQSGIAWNDWLRKE